MSIVAVTNAPFIPAWPQLRPFAAELCIIVTIVANLIVPFFKRRSNALGGLITLGGLFIALLATLVIGAANPPGEFLRGLFVADPMFFFWKILLLTFVIGIVLMWFSTTAFTMHHTDGPEFFTLLLGATLGLSLMVATDNLLMIFMSVELASLPSYVLAGFRKTHRVGAEASLKYVLFGAVCGSLLAYGLSLLYGLFGTLSFHEIASQLATNPSPSSALLCVATLGVLIGIGFKIAAVPVHFWCPDVFEGASVDISAFLSVASKGAAVLLLVRLLWIISAALNHAMHPIIHLQNLAIVIGVIGALTATAGNTAAFVQTNIKRLLAYSSIAQAGYIVCVLSLLVNRNDANPMQHAAGAVLLYLAVYLFMNLGAFCVAGLVYRETRGEKISDFENLGRRSPILAACMTACLFSLIGLPPFAGFVAKLKLMYVLGANGGWAWSLVAVIGFNSVLSLYYYAKIVRVMYFSTNDKPTFLPHPIGAMVSVICAIALVAMLIAFGPLDRITSDYGKIFFPADVGLQSASR